MSCKMQHLATWITLLAFCLSAYGRERFLGFSNSDYRAIRRTRDLFPWEPRGPRTVLRRQGTIPRRPGTIPRGPGAILRGAGAIPRINCPRKCQCYYNVAYCTSRGFPKVPIAFPPNMEFLHLDRNNIRTIPRNRLGNYSMLKTIDLSSNRITNDGIRPDSFAGLTLLKTLDLGDNELTRLPTSLPLSVVELRLAGNQISGINGSSTREISQLSGLYLDRNKITNEGIELDSLALMDSLVNLDLSFNKLEWVPQHLPVSLGNLKLEHNHLKYVLGEIFTSPAEVHHVYLRANQLTEQSFSTNSWANMTRLQFLDLSENRLRYIPGSLPPSLQVLIAESNAIEEIYEWAFFSIPDIMQIRLAFNNIRFIALNAFANLPQLQYLDLSHNKLLHIPRNLPGSVLGLYLESNEIFSIQSDSFCPMDPQRQERSNLSTIRLDNNPIIRRLVPVHAFYCLKSMDALTI